MYLDGEVASGLDIPDLFAADDVDSVGARESSTRNNVSNARGETFHDVV